MPQSPYRIDGLPGIQAGAARRIITPPLGVSLAGYFHDRIAESVRDELHCHALVLASGGIRICLVSCDLISVGGELVHAAKAEIERRTGISPAHVLICATHTHTGPETRKGRVVPTHDAWLAALPTRIGETVEAAAADLFDAILFPGRGRESRLGSNRLGRRPDGSEIFGKEGVVGPAGPVDPELVALSVRDQAGTVRAMLINYAMHPDVIGGGGARFISADWPGEIARAIANFYGERAITVFLNGACGDINHHLWQDTRQPKGGPAKSIQMGRTLAGLAIQATEPAEPLAAADCRADLRLLHIPWYTRDSAIRKEAESLKTKDEPTDFERYVVEATDTWPHDGRIARPPVQVLRFGELIIAGLPGEVFVRWGLEIKHWSPAPYTMVVELANDWFGYIPTTDQAHRGAYGAKPILSRRLCADAGRRMADAVQTMMCTLWSE